MKIAKYGKYYVARLEKGEEIIAALTTAAQKKSLRSAFFFGLGVAKDPVLGYFNAPKKTYIKKAFKGEYELTSFSGNISREKKEIVIHCHVTITDDQFNACGGHLFQATIPATMEILLMPFSPALKRRLNRAAGLHLLDIH
ncbi:DNA-binding protein [candidate division WOR-3 bacterium]|nr:DNA-binding protein [candidate division WOR-3 bacterium]